MATFAWMLLLIASACGSTSSPEPNGTGPLATAIRNHDESLSVLLMARDVEVGEARIPIVVLRTDSDRLDDRLNELAFSYRHADDEQFAAVPEIVWRAWPVRGGAYTGTAEFDRPGIWEFQVLQQTGDARRVGSTFIDVKQDGSAPAVGDRAPLARTKTASTVDEVRQISSAFDPDPGFYELSLDAALTNGKPTIVLFSTPAYCVTETCGPQLDTLGDLKQVHGDRLDFVHVEIFDNIREMLDTGDSSIGVVSQAVEDWTLVTEPWTFIVDSDGVIRARFEQFTTFDELQEATVRLLAGS